MGKKMLYKSYINSYVDAKTCGKYCERKKPRKHSSEGLWGRHRRETGSRKTCPVDLALLWSGWNGQIQLVPQPVSFPCLHKRGIGLDTHQSGAVKTFD